MKKLLAIALVAVMGSVVTAATSNDVYTIKISVKTTAAKAKSVKQECDDPQNICYRVAGSRTFNGYMIGNPCDDVDTPIATIWNTKEKEAIAIGIRPAQLNRFGAPETQKAKSIEAFLNIDDENQSYFLAAAGFGTFDMKNNRISKISGNIVGIIPAPVCSVKCDDPLPSGTFPLCDIETEEIDTTVETTAASGTWSISFDSSATKKTAAIATPEAKMSQLLKNKKIKLPIL